MRKILESATKNKIQFELNEKDNYGNCLLLRAIDRNNTEMVKLIIDYANKNKIQLELNEKDIENYNHGEKDDKELIKSILEIKSEIIRLLLDNKNEKKLNITFLGSNSVLLKRFNEEQQIQLDGTFFFLIFN